MNAPRALARASARAGITMAWLAPRRVIACRVIVSMGFAAEMPAKPSADHAAQRKKVLEAMAFAEISPTDWIPTTNASCRVADPRHVNQHPMPRHVRRQATAFRVIASMVSAAIRRVMVRAKLAAPRKKEVAATERADSLRISRTPTMNARLANAMGMVLVRSFLRTELNAAMTPNVVPTIAPTAFVAIPHAPACASLVTCLVRWELVRPFPWVKTIPRMRHHVWTFVTEMAHASKTLEQHVPRVSSV